MLIFTSTESADCVPFRVENVACSCDPTSATANDCDGASSKKWCNSVDPAVTNTCTSAAVCATSDTAALSAGCVCKASVSDDDAICPSGSYCIKLAAAEHRLTGDKYVCSPVAKASIPACANPSVVLTENEWCKCTNTDTATTLEYCTGDEYCEHGGANGKVAGTCESKATMGGVDSADGNRAVNLDGTTQNTGGATAIGHYCSDSGNAAASDRGDIIVTDITTQDFCVTVAHATVIVGTPYVRTDAVATGTITDCSTKFQVIGMNDLCQTPSQAKYCGGGSYYETDSATGCKAVGASGKQAEVCSNHGTTSNTNACACKFTAGMDISSVGNLFAWPAAGDRACPSGKYCTAQRPGYTFQGMPTCSSAKPTMCHLISATNGPVGGNNGTVFTDAHGTTTGLGEACVCDDKICGAGRACIAKNMTGWSGVKADGAKGATAYAASSQCLSTTINHCPGGNGTVQLDVFVANTAQFSDGGSNKACYCDTSESTICGAGRYCLNNTASGFTGSAECLSSHVVHCTNSSGTTSADEACFCSSSLTCTQGQYCVNGTWFQDDANAAECLAAEISACLNDTLGDGANTAACTCGDKICGAGQFCDSNTTCADAGTATDDEEAGSLAKPMGAVAVLATLVALFASSAL